MNRGWRNGFPRPLVPALVVVIAASSLLFAQSTAEEERSTGAGSAQAAETESSTEPGGDTKGAELRTASEQALSGLTGSKHDFSEDGRDLCATCHTPHLTAAPEPRLDRRVRIAQPLRPYHGIATELDGWSLLCLGCHDGTSAPDVYTSAHATTLASQFGNSRLGTTGLRSHPVGVKYPAPSVEGYHPLAAVEAAGLELPDGFIQCTTCHDAHNTHRHPGMLQSSNKRSRLCLTCHRL